MPEETDPIVAARTLLGEPDEATPGVTSMADKTLAQREQWMIGRQAAKEAMRQAVRPDGNPDDVLALPAEGCDPDWLEGYLSVLPISAGEQITTRLGS